MAKEYDYLIVGAGIYGSTFACMAHRQGKRRLVIDKRKQFSDNSLYIGQNTNIVTWRQSWKK